MSVFMVGNTAGGTEIRAQETNAVVC